MPGIQIRRFVGELQDEEDIRADERVITALDTHWKGLARITIAQLIGVKQVNVATIILESMTQFSPEREGDVREPEEDREEVLTTIYKILYSKSREIGGEFQARIGLYNALGNDPHRFTVRVIAPELEDEEEEEEEEFVDNKLRQSVSENPEILGHDILAYRTQKLYVQAIERTMEVQLRLIEEANMRYNDAARREADMARRGMDQTKREQVLEGALNHVLEQMVRMADAYHDVRKKEAELELEKFKEIEKVKNSGAVLKALGESVAPSLAAVLAMKFGGAKPEDVLGGALPGGVQEGPPPPPPPPPPPGGGGATVVQLDPKTEKVKKQLLESLKELYDLLDADKRAEISRSEDGKTFLEAWEQVKTGDDALTFIRERLSVDGPSFLDDLNALQSMAMGKILATVAMLE